MTRTPAISLKQEIVNDVGGVAIAGTIAAACSGSAAIGPAVVKAFVQRKCVDKTAKALARAVG